VGGHAVRESVQSPPEFARLVRTNLILHRPLTGCWSPAAPRKPKSVDAKVILVMNRDSRGKPGDDGMNDSNRAAGLTGNFGYSTGELEQACRDPTLREAGKGTIHYEAAMTTPSADLKVRVNWVTGTTGSSTAARTLTGTRSCEQALAHPRSSGGVLTAWGVHPPAALRAKTGSTVFVRLLACVGLHASIPRQFFSFRWKTHPWRGPVIVMPEVTRFPPRLLTVESRELLSLTKRPNRSARGSGGTTGESREPLQCAPRCVIYQVCPLRQSGGVASDCRNTGAARPAKRSALS
jgi:hypothetical protein